jgi:hypothetical protein
MKRRARQYYEHTNELIRRIEAKLGDGENPRARRLLRIAREHQDKARAAVEEGQPYRALHHARAARRVVTEIMRFVFRARQLDIRVERMEGAVERARDAVEESDNERAEEVLERGVERYERARELAEDGADVRATAELDAAAKLIARSVEMARGDSRRARIINIRVEIRKTTAVVRRADALAETNGQENRVRMARELIEEARAEAGNPEKALALLDKATDIAFSVIAQVRRHPDKPEDDEGERE